MAAGLPACGCVPARVRGHSGHWQGWPAGGREGLHAALARLACAPCMRLGEGGGRQRQCCCAVPGAGSALARPSMLPSPSSGAAWLASLPLHRRPSNHKRPPPPRASACGRDAPAKQSSRPRRGAASHGQRRAAGSKAQAVEGICHNVHAPAHTVHGGGAFVPLPPPPSTWQCICCMRGHIAPVQLFVECQSSWCSPSPPGPLAQTLKRVGRCVQGALRCVQPRHCHRQPIRAPCASGHHLTPRPGPGVSRSVS